MLHVPRNALSPTTILSVLLVSCSLRREAPIRSLQTASPQVDLGQAWSAVQQGHYQMVVTAERGEQSVRVRRVEAWWDRRTDLLRVEEYDGQDRLYWILLKRGDVVWSVDVPQRKAQKLILRRQKPSSLVVRLHPDSVLWQEASLLGVQALAGDPLRLTVWTTERTAEQVERLGNTWRYRWKAPDGGALVSAELEAESLLPIRCEVLYPNGKRVRYTYRVRAGADIRREVYSLPQTSSFEEHTIRHPLELGEQVTLLRPALPNGVEEGPGHPDPFSGGDTDWYSAHPNTRHLSSAHELFTQTGIREISLPSRWGAPREVVYVKETSVPSVPPLEIARLTFHPSREETFRLEIQRVPASFTGRVENLLGRPRRWMAIQGHQVGILPPSPPHRPAWSATWVDAQREQVISLEHLGNEEQFLRRLHELLRAGR